MECTGTDASARSGIDWPIAADDRGCRPAPRRSSTATWSEETAPTEEANPAAASGALAAGDRDLYLELPQFRRSVIHPEEKPVGKSCRRARISAASGSHT
jgi:hypothetical protein